MPQQGLRAGPGGRTRRRPAVHGAPWARGHPGAGPAGRRNQRVPGGGHRPLASFIALWPASCCWTGSGPHGCCARPAVDLGIVEDHAWAGTVRSARNPARSSATMGRRQLLQPGRPRTAWIGELTATGRSSSGQAGQPPALSGQTAFFRVLERIPAGSEGLRVAGTRSVPDRWPAGWSEAGDGAVLACIYRCIGRGEGSRAMDKTRATETRGTWQKPLLVVCLRNNRVLWRPSASRRSVPLPQRTAAGTPSSAGLARNTAADAIPHHHFTDRPLAGRPCCRHSSPAELRRVAHMASQELPRGGRERVSGVSHLPCEQF